MLVVNIRRFNQCRPDGVSLRNEHPPGLQQATAGINDRWNSFLVEGQNPVQISYQHVAWLGKLDLE
jgi:hypothetical protein